MKTKTKIISALSLIILAGLAVLGIFWFSQSAKLEATDQKAEAILAEKFNQTPEIKNSYQLNKLALVKPAEDENAAEITVGDPNASTFVPELTVKKWDGEASFNMKYTGASIQTAKNEAATPGVNLDNNKIIYSDGTSDVHFYEKPKSQINPDGAYEVEFILKEKPTSNIVTTDIEIENLDFFYQPALNQEIKIGEDGIISCTETQCFDKNKKVIRERSENVVGSYAVYYKDNKSGDYSQMGGKNYKTGKAFHIYRPQATDAVGNKVWGELNVDTDKGILAVTVPQDFLDNAVYPVTVDPTFGYGSKGGAAFTPGANNIYGTQYMAPSSNGTLQSISFYTLVSGATLFKYAIYLQSTHALVAITSEASLSSYDDWKLLNTTTNPSVTSGTNYAVEMMFNDDKTTIYYDSSSYGDEEGFQVYTYGNWPDPLVASWVNPVKFSSYATYTSGPSAPTVTNSTGASNVNFTAARLNGEVTATGGENPTVHIYWGTTDGGTTAGSWANDVNLGALGAGTFYTDISSLTAGTTYYYRSYATNSGGNDWADSTATFNTTAPSAVQGGIKIEGGIKTQGGIKFEASGVAAPACDDGVWFCSANTTCSDTLGDGANIIVKRTDESSTKQWKTSNTNCDKPNCAQDGGQDGDNLVADNTVDFSSYPARDACKAVGGRLPTLAELQCIYANKTTFGNNFVAYYYWSSTEYSTTYARLVNFASGTPYNRNKSLAIYVRCVKGW